MYILIFKINNDYILATGKDGTIVGYPTPEAILEDFKGYVRQFSPGASYESYASAGVGMMNTQPKGLLFSLDAAYLKPFITDTAIMIHSGLGFKGIVGVKVDKSLLENEEIVDIWKECMIAGGIYDPLKSDFQNPFKFSL